MKASTEEDYQNLPLAELGLDGISFDDFSFYTEKEIQDLCEKLPDKLKLPIRRIWKRHPNNLSSGPGA
jgi:hypothetical protein